jgi:hypothetical protein
MRRAYAADGHRFFYAPITPENILLAISLSIVYHCHCFIFSAWHKRKGAAATLREFHDGIQTGEARQKPRSVKKTWRNYYE